MWVVFMKKRIYLIVISIILLTFAGCNSYQVDNDNIIESESNPFPDYKYNQEAAQSPYGQSSMAISETGYYYIIDDILYFYNINSDINMPLCSKSNCKHKDKECDAYVNSINAYTADFSCNCMEGKLFYYNNHLYCIEITSDRDYYLYQYNDVFGDKKCMAHLASVKNKQNAVTDAGACLISNGYLYFYTTTMDEQYAQKGCIADYQCNRIKLEENAVIEELGEFEFPGDYAMKAGESNGLAIYCSNENIYFYAGGTVRWYSQENRVRYWVAKFDVKSNRFDMIWTYTGDETKDILGKDTGNVNVLSGGEYVQMDAHGNFYILTASEKDVNIDVSMIVKVNFENSTSNVIYKTPKEQIYSLRSDGEMLYFFETTSGRDTTSWLTAIHMDGTIQSSLELQYDEEYLSYMEDYYKHFPDADVVKPGASDLIICGIDERFILLKCPEGCNVFKGLTSSNIYKISESMDKITGAGVIDKSKYLKNEETSIKQIYQCVL